MPDEDLIDLAKKEMQMLGLIRVEDVEDGTVVRMPKAYPVYDSTYKESLSVIRNFLNRLPNLQLVGRNGMHKYNNQDHSMLTAMLAVKNILGERYDLWAVNADPEYHEEVTAEESQDEFALLASQQPSVPERLEPLLEPVVIKSLARMDKLAFAVSIGTVSAVLIWFATMFLVWEGGPVVGPNLSLLREYVFGYTVTPQGAWIGFGYCFFWGFFFGWLFAYLRNLAVGIFLYYVRKEAEASSFRNLLDYL
jgi:hypothetical protein